MISALEAKMKAFRKMSYYETLNSKINEAADNGLMQCAIGISDELSGKLYDMINFLNEFGYQTVVNGDTLIISWFPNWGNHMSYVDDFDEEEYQGIKQFLLFC